MGAMGGIEKKYVINRSGEFNYPLLERMIASLCKNKCDYRINYSKTTNSVYVNLIRGETTVSFRISDHEKKDNFKAKYTLPTIYVRRSTRIGKVEKFIQSKIRSLNTLHTRMCINAIKEVEDSGN